MAGRGCFKVAAVVPGPGHRGQHFPGSASVPSWTEPPCTGPGRPPATESVFPRGLVSSRETVRGKQETNLRRLCRGRGVGKPSRSPGHSCLTPTPSPLTSQGKCCSPRMTVSGSWSITANKPKPGSHHPSPHLSPVPIRESKWNGDKKESLGEVPSTFKI